MGPTLPGKVAVVTGAGGGVGEAIARAMAAEGARVIVNDLGGQPDGKGASTSMADQVVCKIKDEGGTAVPSYDSVATLAGAQRIIQTALDRFGRIDILVNSAGVDRLNFIWDMTEEDWDLVVNVHLKGTWACCKFASAPMRDQRSGRIINIGSDNGVYGSIGQTNYSAAKGGIHGLTRALALELGKHGVTANVLCPAAETRLSAVTRAFRAKHGIVKQRTAKEQASYRDPADVAPLAVYLARDEAANINGQMFRACRGDFCSWAQPGLSKIIHKEGRWTQEELTVVFPSTLGADLVNPVP